jgi:hypothetical protein
VYIEGDYYSAPHIHRHKKLRVKITEIQVEIFLSLERLAIYPRSRHRNGKRVFIDAHFPRRHCRAACSAAAANGNAGPASQAYYEATPQRLLCQSKFIHPDLNQLFVELLHADVFGNGKSFMRASLVVASIIALLLPASRGVSLGECGYLQPLRSYN